jgi:cytochrome c oxidase subunit II
MTPRMSVLDPGGPQADRIASLWDAFLYLSIAVWVLVVAFLAIAALKAHRRRSASEDGDPLVRDPALERRLIRGVIVAGGATVVVLFALLVSSILTGRALASLETDADAVHVRVIGHQWWWEIQYERLDPYRAASTVNELHLPTGRPVILELTSADVIHSFWVPSIHGKKDLIPGRMNRTWIRIDEPGEYRGQCAEFCGLEHANMAITLIAEPRDAFEHWLDHQRNEAGAAMTESSLRGQRLFMGGPCAACHSIAGTPAGGRLGPDLTHLASRTFLGAGAVPNNPLSLAHWILDPHALKPGVHMPATSLSSDDLADLVSYLETLQ